jgi:hypothetical protein
MTKYSNSKLLRRSVKGLISALKNLDLASVDEVYLESRIRELLNIGYLSRLLNINHPSVYRVRINETPEPFENTKQLWWPPPECIKVRGRLNDVGESVFYCSDSENTAIIEKQPKVGDVLTVLEAELIDPNKKPLVTELGLYEFTAKSNPNYGGVPPEFDSRQKQFMRREGISQTNPVLRHYLTNEFLKNVAPGKEHEYKTTIAIGHILTDGTEIVNDDGDWVTDTKIDGLSYPSVASETLGANTALRTEAADTLYKGVACTVYRVEKRESITHYTVGELMKSKSIDRDGTINWVVTGVRRVSSRN